jgi:hypothetical protein
MSNYLNFDIPIFTCYLDSSFLYNKFVYYPSDLLYSIKCYLRNRYVTQTHVLKSDLKKRQLDFTRASNDWFKYSDSLVYSFNKWHEK